MKFVNLHGHTGMSLYDGLGSPEDYAEWMLKNAGENAGALAITDHGNLNAAGQIVTTQQKYDKKDVPVKFIYGVEAYYIPSLVEWEYLKLKKAEEKKEQKRKAKEEPDDDLVIEDSDESKELKKFDPFKRKNHLVLNAYNQKGLENLFRLISRSYKEGMYYKPRIDLAILQQHNEGLVASTACITGIPGWCSAHDLNNEEIMSLYHEELDPIMELFGKDRFFLELQFNKLELQKYTNSALIEFAKRTGYHLIATADCHYPRPEMFRDREIYRLLGYQMKKKDIDMSILEKEVDELECQLYLKNGDQIFEAYKDTFADQCSDEQLIIDAIERTYSIAHDFIGRVTPQDEIKLPKTFQVTENIKTPFDKLKQLVLQALKDKELTSKEYVQRAVFELSVIKKLGHEEYFLAKKEILDVLKKHMLLGPGRGSGAGSLVNYLLGITLVDPIRFGLLFERFLSMSRAEMPDIDSDVELKDEALDILKDHFGEDNVLAVSNYNRLQLKSLVKDISRLYGVSYEEVNAVTRIMEDEAKGHIMEEIGHDQKLYEFTYEKARQYSKTFARYMEKYPDVGSHIENLFKEVKSIGRHAGGVLIVPDANGQLPIIRVRGVNQSPIVEGITAQHLKYFGLIKFDILGLATLRIIRRCIENILKIKEGVENPTIDDIWKWYNENLHPDVIDFDDRKVFKATYKAGKFPSIFQFSEQSMQNFCKRAKPESMMDISAIGALWRPGPLKGMADKRYLAAQESDVKKLHPIVQEVLGETRGVLLYQEQFMLLANKLAGFSLDDSDKLRKLLVKPATSLAEEMKKERIEIGNRFVRGCMENGMVENRANALWEKEILGFISYGFNKCVDGKTKLYRPTISKGRHYTVEELFLIKNNIKFAKSINAIPMRSKLLKNGYGYCWSLNEENKLVKNKIKDIRYAGYKLVYQLVTESGATIGVTDNHKFPTQRGEKRLKDIIVGEDSVYINQGWKQADTTYRFFLEENNYPTKGQKGFQKRDAAYTQLQEYITNHKKDFCEICGKNNCRLEIHHENGNHGDNRFENLMTICISCHKKAHYLMGRTKMGEAGLPTKPEKVVAIISTTEKDVYDIEMETPYHTFTVDSGIVTSNSHSVSYAINSYHCAWLFTYYDTCWIKACLECGPNLERTINTVRSLGFVVGKPDVNFSQVDDWYIGEDKLCVPALTSLKNVGITASEELVRNRPEGGFEDIYDFFYKDGKWRWSKFNKKALQALIRMDAFEGFGCIGPGKLFANSRHMEDSLFNNWLQVKGPRKKLMTLEEAAFSTPDDDWTTVEKMTIQKDIVGFYDKGLIVQEYQSVLDEFDVKAIDQVPDDKAKSHIWGIVEEVVEKKTKTGRPFLVVTASGMSDYSYRFRVWNTSKDLTPLWREGYVLVFSLSYSKEYGYSVSQRSRAVRLTK